MAAFFALTVISTLYLSPVFASPIASAQSCYATAYHPVTDGSFVNATDPAWLFSDDRYASIVDGISNPMIKPYDGASYAYFFVAPNSPKSLSMTQQMLNGTDNEGTCELSYWYHPVQAHRTSLCTIEAAIDGNIIDSVTIKPGQGTKNNVWTRRTQPCSGSPQGLQIAFTYSCPDVGPEDQPLPLAIDGIDLVTIITETTDRSHTDMDFVQNGDFEETDFEKQTSSVWTGTSFAIRTDVNLEFPAYSGHRSVVFRLDSTGQTHTIRQEITNLTAGAWYTLGYARRLLYTELAGYDSATKADKIWEKSCVLYTNLGLPDAELHNQTFTRGEAYRHISATWKATAQNAILEFSLRCESEVSVGAFQIDRVSLIQVAPAMVDCST